MIFVDTGYLIALVDSGDALHSLAMAWTRHLHEPLLTTDYVTLETINYFSGTSLRLRSQKVLDGFSSRANSHIVHVDASLRDDGIALHRGRSDKLWSLTDCVSFVVMDQHQIQRALAFDHHFEKAGFEALLRRDLP